MANDKREATKLAAELGYTLKGYKAFTALGRGRLLWVTVEVPGARPVEFKGHPGCPAYAKACGFMRTMKAGAL